LISKDLDDAVVVRSLECVEATRFMYLFVQEEPLRESRSSLRLKKEFASK
jgi:hypothetical protein